MPVCKKFYKPFTELKIHILKVGFFMECFWSPIIFLFIFFLEFIIRKMIVSLNVLYWSKKCDLFFFSTWLSVFTVQYSTAVANLPGVLLHLPFSSSCVCLCAAGGGQRTASIVVLWLPSTLFFVFSGFFVCFSDLRSFTDLGLEVDWSSGQQAPGIYLPVATPSSLGLQVHTITPVRFFMWV